MRMILAFIACLATAASCTSSSTSDSEDLARRILAAEAAELAAWEARDIRAIMNAYAPDAIVMPGGSTVANTDELRKLFLNFLADPAFTLTFRSDPPLVAASGEIGVTVGTYALTFTDTGTQAIGRRTGRHLMTWQRQGDGTWRVIRQMTAHDR